LRAIRLAVGVAFAALAVGASPLLAFSELTTADEQINRLTARTDLFTVGVNALQVQYYRDEGNQLADGTPIGEGTALGRNGFTLRRAELYARGRVSDTIRYDLIFDLNGSGTILREGFIDLIGPPYAALRFGQFRIPFGIETQHSAKNLVFIDRMLTSSLGEQQKTLANFVQERDLGVRLAGEPISGPINVSYALALVNGDGLNTVDVNELKDSVGRVGIRLAGFQVGSSVYRGRRRDAAAPFLNRDRTRVGWDAEINPNPLKALLIRGELVSGRDDSTTRRGWYVLAAYRFTDRWEPAARIERWDPDRAAGNDTFSRTTLGVNYHIAGDTRLAVNYEFRDDKAHPALDNLALAQYQISF
jgi:hypothetical protein